MKPPKARRFAVAQLDELTPLRCPCGLAHRAFQDLTGRVASVHLVEISAESKVHYHKRITEIYVVLEGTGFIELDGRRFNLKPLAAVYIQPGCRHRAVGQLRLLNIPIPAFDRTDEFHDP